MAHFETSISGRAECRGSFEKSLLSIAAQKLSHSRTKLLLAMPPGMAMSLNRSLQATDSSMRQRTCAGSLKRLTLPEIAREIRGLRGKPTRVLTPSANVFGCTTSCKHEHATETCQNGYCARQPLTAGGCLLRVKSAAEASYDTPERTTWNTSEHLRRSAHATVIVRTGTHHHL